MAVCPHSANFAVQLRIKGYKNKKIMDIFLMAVRFLGVMAEIKEKTTKVLG